MMDTKVVFINRSHCPAITIPTVAEYFDGKSGFLLLVNMFCSKPDPLHYLCMTIIIY